MTQPEIPANAGLTQAQLDACWMPFTGNRNFKRDPRLIISASGNYYTSADGRRIFDGLSGLWTCGLGHGRPEISEAVSQQIMRLDYAPAFQFGHPGIFQLAEKVSSFMPDGLNRVFFTGSGSEAVDTALKIARAYWCKRGQGSKTRLIGRIKGYHGVNFGGIAVGGIGPNRSLYGESLTSAHLPHTQLDSHRFCRGQPAQGRELADALLDLIALYGATTIAAVIVEPLAGSAGVIPPPVGYLERLHEICQQHNILLIFDEVICAFGRLGSCSGAEAFGVKPDIMTLAKQLTNGAVPMGAVALKQEIYDTFMDQGGPDYALELPHGYTYSGHPLACAAALAALQLLEDEEAVKQAANLASPFEDALHSLKGLSHVVDIRNFGLAGGISLAQYPGEPLRRPYEVAMAMWQKGFYIRYGGDTIQLGPPFGAEYREIDLMINALGDVLSTQA
ncbi:MAG: aspartate aminotransferase family protein [Parahaliea sp.]